MSIKFSNIVNPTELPPAVVGSNDQGLPVGTNRAVVTIYSPHSASQVTVDGQPAALQTERELDLYAHTLMVDIEPGATVDITLLLSGRIDPDQHAEYELALAHQPMGYPDEWRISFDAAPPWTTPSEAPVGFIAAASSADGSVLWEGALTNDHFVSFKPIS